MSEINSCVRKFLMQNGYTVNENAYQIIEACDDWYRARELDAHHRTTVNGVHYTMERMGFGARVASDDANLCEVIEINAGGGNDAQYDFVNDMMKANRFDTQFRRQLEMTSAEGTSACYVRLEDAVQYDDGTLKGGNIRLTYVDAMGFVPLTVVNDEVIEAAFWGDDVTGGKKTTTVVLCTRDDAGRYQYKVRAYDDQNRDIAGAAQDVTLGEIKPFAVLHTALVNTLDNMEGFGYPKLHGVIPVLRGLDAAYTALMGDIDTAEKITIINEVLCDFRDDGKPITPTEQMKRRFVMLGEGLPDKSSMVHEITPAIRVDEFREVIELLMNLLGQQFGYGTKKYSFDRASNALVTATQYIGERQDMMQELNRQRYHAREYIAGIVRAMLWFSNAYQGSAWDLNAEVLVDFDDSYITNQAEELAEIRNDIALGIGGAYVRQQYLMKKYNLDEVEAAKWAAADDPDRKEEPED